MGGGVGVVMGDGRPWHVLQGLGVCLCVELLDKSHSLSPLLSEPNLSLLGKVAGVVGGQHGATGC